MMTDLWTYRDYEWGSSNTDLRGYKVQTVDGDIGSVEQATSDVGASYLVVDVTPWMVGKKVLLPAGLIERVDIADERVYANCTRDGVRSAPEFDEQNYTGDAYQGAIGAHYGQGGPGYREEDSPLADPTIAGTLPSVGAHPPSQVR